VTYDPAIGDGPDRDSERLPAPRFDARLVVGLVVFAAALIVASAVSFAGEAGKGELDEALLGPRAESTVRGDIYKLEAKAGGKYSVRRGGEVELDGSASKPARKITSYTWTFSSAGRVASKGGGGGGCPVTPKPGSKSGKTPEVDALCDIRATLTVSDGQTTATDTARINVKPRNFKIPFDQDGTDDIPMYFALSSPFGTQSCEGCRFGANRCSVEWPRHRNLSGNHWLHPKDDSPPRFKVKRIQDNGGPFDGYFYVDDLNVKLTRTIIVNSELLRGGSVYRLNKNNEARLADLERLVASTRRHEKIHGNLAREGINKGEGLKMFDKTMGNNENDVRTLASGYLGNAENDALDATTEEKVIARMREIYGDETATIIVPRASGGGSAPHTFPLAEKGATG
jgi:hypothetical protein